MANKFHPEPQGKPIHFFKIVLAHSLQEGKLMIPRTFVEKYGEGLPKTVFLKPPNGVEWKVNLVKHDGEIWFQNGWKEFAEYHSLAPGHLVVFRYERTSHFQVHIFDPNALEIDYPFKRVEGKRASNDQGNKPPKVENSEDHRPGQKRKDNSSLEFFQPCKMRSSSRCVEVESISNFSKEALHLTGIKGQEEPMTTAKQITALDRASSFKPCNPSFLVVMYPSYIHSKANLNLPSKFCKRHFDFGKKWGDINLRSANGSVWPAKYLIRKIKKGKKIELSKGWNPFAKDNNLKVGDVCSFELIDRTKLTFQVYIFRETDNSNCPTSQESTRMRAACQGQRKGMKINTTTESSPSGSFNSFAGSLKSDPVHIFDTSALETDYTFKRVEGKRASNDQGNKPLKVENLEDYRPGIKRKDNSSLEILQLCKMRSRSVKVASASNIPKAVLHHTGKKCQEEPMTTAKPITALDRACSFKPCNPSFLVVMHPSYVHSHAHMNLPSRFGKSHFDLGKKWGDINLRLSNGRVWPVRYLTMKYRTRTKFELSTGWKAFANENNLKVGDVCTFELIDRAKLTFQVYIFRATGNSNCPTSQESAQMRTACQGQTEGMKIKTTPATTTTKPSPPESLDSLLSWSS